MSIVADGPPGTRPGGEGTYTVRQAALRLGVSYDAVYDHYADFGGFKVGRRILLPRSAVDGLLAHPPPVDAALAPPTPTDGDGSGHDGATAPLDRTLALLEALTGPELLRVIQEAVRRALVLRQDVGRLVAGRGRG